MRSLHSIPEIDQVSHKMARAQRKKNLQPGRASRWPKVNFLFSQIALSMLFISFALCAEELDIFGYYEPQLMTAKFDDHFYNSASNKLRLDVGKKWDNISFGANINYITYHAKTEWNLLDYVPKHISAQIPGFMQEYFTYYFGDMAQWIGPLPTPRPDRIYLDNAFAKIRYKKADITVGKQQLNMGTGYTWNPTDHFNVKNILDPTYEQTGHNAIRLELALHPKLSIDSYVAPGEEMQDSRLMLKIKSNVGRFDVSLLGLQNNWQRTDYLNPTAIANPDAAFSTFQRQTLGGDLVGELFGLGVWAEGGYNFVHRKSGAGLPDLDDFWEIVLGLDYTLNSGLYLMGEFYHNSMLPKRWQDYTLNHWMWYFSTETRAMSRDNFFGLAQYPLTDLVTIGAMVIQSISDGSAAIVPMLTWSMFEDADLLTYLNINTGKDGQAYARQSGSGGILRLRVYF